MWPWRRRSQFADLDLPKKCFISHSYQDAQERERLLALLPKNVEPFIFPPITAEPTQLISNHLIEAILACDGLIYLTGQYSSESFWVAFERDYALRAGKRVFSFADGQNVLTPDTSLPLQLRLFPTWAQGDTARVRAILDFMRDERFFQPFDLDHLQRLIAADGEVDLDIVLAFERMLSRRGNGVFFWSEHAGRSRYFMTDLMAGAKMNERVLVALLDNTGYEKVIPWRVERPVQLYGDGERSERQRIDDLIVRLYWLSYRNTLQNQLT